MLVGVMKWRRADPSDCGVRIAVGIISPLGW